MVSHVILCACLQKRLKPSINERDNEIVKQLKAITVHCIDYNYKLDVEIILCHILCRKPHGTLNCH